MCGFTFLFLLFALTSYNLSGQSLFKEGYILISPFDTLRKEIKYKSYNKTSLNCTFRDSSGSISTFELDKLFGYGIEDQLYFVSKSIGANNM